MHTSSALVRLRPHSAARLADPLDALNCGRVRHGAVCASEARHFRDASRRPFCCDGSTEPVSRAIARTASMAISGSLARFASSSRPPSRTTGCSSSTNSGVKNTSSSYFSRGLRPMCGVGLRDVMTHSRLRDRSTRHVTSRTRGRLHGPCAPAPTGRSIRAGISTTFFARCSRELTSSTKLACSRDANAGAA